MTKMEFMEKRESIQFYMSSFLLLPEYYKWLATCRTNHKTCESIELLVLTRLCKDHGFYGSNLRWNSRKLLMIYIIVGFRTLSNRFWIDSPDPHKQIRLDSLILFLKANSKWWCTDLAPKRALMQAICELMIQQNQESIYSTNKTNQLEVHISKYRKITVCDGIPLKLEDLIGCFSKRDNPLLFAVMCYYNCWPKDVCLSYDGGYFKKPNWRCEVLQKHQTAVMEHFTVASSLSTSVEALLQTEGQLAGIKTVMLTGCGQIKEDAGAAISSLLKECKSVEMLDVRGALINGTWSCGSAGLMCLVDNLSQLSLDCLRSIRLKYCGLDGANGGLATSKLIRLCGEKIEEVYLAVERCFGSEGLVALASGLDERVFASMKRLTLRQCGLQGLEAGRALKELLARWRNIEELDLTENRLFGDTGLNGLALKGNPPLSFIIKLTLEDCGLKGATGGRSLGHLLHWCGDGLEELYIGGNDLGACGMNTLVRGVGRNFNHIRYIGLQKCGLSGVEGGKAVAKFLSICGLSIESLNLANNEELGFQGLESLVDSLPKNKLLNLRKIRLGMCGLTGKESGRAISVLLNICGDNIEELNLRENKQLGAKGLENLVETASPIGFPQLKIIELKQCGLDELEGGKAIGQLLNICGSYLEELILYGNLLGVEGLLMAFTVPNLITINKLYVFEGARHVRSILPDNCKVNQIID
eukprot:Platyproteum_vivax@DN6052_c0_g1_i1.p1